MNIFIESNQPCEDHSKLPKTKAEAKLIGQKHYFTGKKCKHGHIAKRFVSNGHCIECINAFRRKYYADNPEIALDRQRKYRAENPEMIAAKRIKYAKENSEVIKARLKRYRKENRETILVRKRKYYADYPDRVNATNARRRANKLNQTPADADHKKINKFYKTTSELKKIYGADLHVDHIIALDNGGLHCHTNLQILYSVFNLEKGAKTDYAIPNQIDEEELTDPTIIEWLGTF